MVRPDRFYPDHIFCDSTSTDARAKPFAEQGDFCEHSCFISVFIEISSLCGLRNDWKECCLLLVTSHLLKAIQLSAIHTGGVKSTVLYFPQQCFIFHSADYIAHLLLYGKYSTLFVFDLPTQSTLCTYIYVQLHTQKQLYTVDRLFSRATNFVNTAKIPFRGNNFKN